VTSDAPGPRFFLSPAAGDAWHVGRKEGGSLNGGRRIRPYWVARLFPSNPLRRLLENPMRLLGPHVQAGTTVLDLGCAPGFFTLPLARMVGPASRVIALDVQPRMLRGLQRRARRAAGSGSDPHPSRPLDPVAKIFLIPREPPPWAPAASALR
jgi:SAM-dependent methyltransferase